MAQRASYVLILGAVSVALSGVASTAADINGAWTNDRENCAKVFTTQGGKTVLTTNADFYGSGFVIDGNIIRGKSATCKIKSMSQKGNKIAISASCATDVMMGDTRFSLILGDDGRLTRSFPGMPEMTMDYFRCSQ